MHSIGRERGIDPRVAGGNGEFSTPSDGLGQHKNGVPCLPAAPQDLHMDREVQFACAICAPIEILQLFLRDGDQFSRLVNCLDIERAAKMIDGHPRREMNREKRFWQRSNSTAFLKHCGKPLEAVEDTIGSQYLHPPSTVATNLDVNEFRQSSAQFLQADLQSFRRAVEVSYHLIELASYFGGAFLGCPRC